MSIFSSLETEKRTKNHSGRQIFRNIYSFLSFKTNIYFSNELN